MSTQHAERLADPVGFWTNVKARALAGGHQWIVRMVEAIDQTEEQLAAIESAPRD